MVYIVFISNINRLLSILLLFSVFVIINLIDIEYYSLFIYLSELYAILCFDWINNVINIYHLIILFMIVILIEIVYLLIDVYYKTFNIMDN